MGKLKLLLKKCLILTFILMYSCGVKKESMLLNKVYLKNKEYIFEYSFFDEDNNKLYYEFYDPLNELIGKNKPNWKLETIKTYKSIDKIGMHVLDGSVNGNQIAIMYKYYSSGKIVDEEVTGLIKNNKSLWIHPPRSKSFRILELTPFPYIDFSSKEWEQTLVIGEDWGDKRWKDWEGEVSVKNSYSNNGMKPIISTFGPVKCYEITGEGSSRLGKSKLVAYYNENYGFVRFDYSLINNTKLIFNLVEIRSNK